MRKVFVGFVVMGFAAVVLAGCGTGDDASPVVSDTQAPPASTPGLDEEVTLEVLWMGWDATQVDPLMQAFEDANPGIKLEYSRIPFGELFSTIEIRLSARNPSPDILIVDGPLTASYASRGYLMDLTDAFAGEMDRFTEAAVDQGMWEGRLYSAPFVSSMEVMYYNVDLFEAAGIKPPSANPDQRWTWERIYEAAKTIRQLEGDPWGFVFEQSDGPYQILPLPVSNGAQVISDDGLTASGYVDSPKFIEAMEFYQSLFENDVTPAVHKLSIGQEIFGSGQAGMMVGGTWGAQQLDDNFPDLNWAVAPFPYFEDGTPVTPTGSWHIGVNARTEKEEAALTFVRWMSSDEAGELFFGLRSYVPIQRALFDTVLPENDTWSIIRYELDNTAVPRPKTPGYRQYEDILRRAFQDIDAGADVTQTLQDAAAEIDEQLKEYRK